MGRRRTLLAGAALAALLVIFWAAPAGAVPANEVLIAKNLQRLGAIPPYATTSMARGAVAVVAGSEEKESSKPPVAVQDDRSTSLGEYLQARQGSRVAAATPYTANILVLLVEFGDDPWPAGSPAPTGPMLNGPVHGTIPAPQPDDNATYWPGDFSPSHFQQMLFGTSYPIYDGNGLLRGSSTATLRNYFLEQSHGVYTVDGTVGNWVQLDLPESWYGADDGDGRHDVLTGPRWRLAHDALLKFAQQNPNFNWSQYDRENPWGITGEAFAQPDGYIDHLVIVHAGVDQSAGGGLEGTDALWAHSGTIAVNEAGGPGDGPGVMIPGTEGQGPEGKGIWAGPYTQDPEDGGTPVFAHEFGHDLGLDDQYDYSSQNPTGDTSSAFWTLMADGSWLGYEYGIGSNPGPMNADDKANLGFVKPKVVKRGKTQLVKLQRASTGTAAATAVKIALPPAKHPITLTGADGSQEWYSQMGNNLNNALTTKQPIAITAGTSLTYRTWYEIETGYDFGFVVASADGGATWDVLQQYTGVDTAHWGDTVTVDLSEYAGSSILLRFAYVTDYSVMGRGWEVTDITVGGTPLPQAGFVSDGWVRTDGRYVFQTEQFYIAEYRGNGGFDEATTHCYQFNWTAASLVDWYSYNRGLHLIYRDAFWPNNDVADHPGYGARMVVDAQPRPDSVVYDGLRGIWRPRIQVRDAAFSLAATPKQSIYFIDYVAGTGVGTKVAPGKPAQPWFKDTQQYWYANDPLSGVKLPKLGVRIQVQKVSASSMTILVDNTP